MRSGVFRENGGERVIPHHHNHEHHLFARAATGTGFKHR